MKERKVLRHKLSRQFRHKQNKLGIEKLDIWTMLVAEGIQEKQNLNWEKGNLELI